MTHRPLVLLVLLAGACEAPEPRPGTFVGNPSLTAGLSVRIADNEVQQVVRGVFEAVGVDMRGCEEAIEPLGRVVLRFEGPNSVDVVPMDVGEHCGLFFAVDQFTVTFDDGGQPITIIADDFDLSIDSRFVARRGDEVVLRFGDEAWLADVAALAPRGETRLGADHPALTRAFFEGLHEGSEILNFR